MQLRWLAALVVLPSILQAQTDSRIEAIAQGVVGKTTPGLAVVVMQRGEVVHCGAYGIADVERRIPFTVDSPFYIASLGKMFTALGTLQLIDEGKLTFDTKLGDALQNVPAYARNVTIRQVLTHTSGLPDHYELDPRNEAVSYTHADVDRLLAGADSLLFVPGAKPSYSNSGYVLLARIIAQKSGMPYARFVRERFFDRAGMRSATVITGPADLPAQRVHGYRSADDRFTLHDVEPVADMAVGAGGMYASINDLLRWAQALRAGAIVSPALMKEASTAAMLNSGKQTYWGMGWLAEFHGKKDPLAGKEYVAAVGSLRGFRALLKWYQAEDLVIIWLANSDSSDVFDAMNRIAGLYLKAGGGEGG